MNTGKATKHAARERYQPVPFDVEATHRRWMKGPGYAETYAALEGAYSAVGELLRARQEADMSQAKGNPTRAASR